MKHRSASVVRPWTRLRATLVQCAAELAEAATGMGASVAAAARGCIEGGAAARAAASLLVVFQEEHGGLTQPPRTDAQTFADAPASVSLCAPPTSLSTQRLRLSIAAAAAPPRTHRLDGHRLVILTSGDSGSAFSIGVLRARRCSSTCYRPCPRHGCPIVEFCASVEAASSKSLLRSQASSRASFRSRSRCQLGSSPTRATAATSLAEICKKRRS